MLKAIVVKQGYILIPNIDGLNDKHEADKEWLIEKGPKNAKEAAPAEAE